MQYKITFTFSKKGIIKFISHLDLMRTFTRAFRRADMPLKITQGFSPHPKLSIKRALKLGVESDSEEATVILKQFLNTRDFKDKLQAQLPEGIQVNSVNLLPVV